MADDKKEAKVDPKAKREYVTLHAIRYNGKHYAANKRVSMAMAEAAPLLKSGYLRTATEE